MNRFQLTELFDYSESISLQPCLFINAPNTDDLTQTLHVPTCPAPPRSRRSYKASFILKL